MQHHRKLWHFPGGLPLPDYKSISTVDPIRRPDLPKLFHVPLNQHIGAPSIPLVAAGDRVLKGQTIARADGEMSAPVHAPTSGRVTGLVDYPLPHPSGLSAPCLVIEPDGRETWAQEQAPIEDYTAVDPGALCDRVHWAGVVGLGGAVFPARAKLCGGPDRHVDTLIINGAECEPYISCDDILMRERPESVIEGTRMLLHILGVRHCIIGVEDCQKEAAARLREALHLNVGEHIEIAEVPSIYPTGGERQLIKVLTDRDVPSNGLPPDIGVICHNVGTAAAVFDAVRHGRPMISRVVTVTGDGVRHPANFDALLGTPVSHLIEACGGYRANAGRLIMGGPMMGYTLHSDQVPVVKATNCILALPQEEVSRKQPALPCIRCGECAQVCPARLLPQQLYWYARAKDFDQLNKHNLFDCIECGCCAYVCPSHLPLVQYYRFAKAEIRARNQIEAQAEAARRRFEFRTRRLERIKQERAERLRQKKLALQNRS